MTPIFAPGGLREALRLESWMKRITRTLGEVRVVGYGRSWPGVGFGFGSRSVMESIFGHKLPKNLVQL